MGGIAVLASSAVAVSAISAFLPSLIPKVGGWALFTPLNGFMLAALLMSRRKLWPFLLLGYVLALSLALGVESPKPGALEIFCDVTELLLAAFTLPPYRGLKQWLQEPRLLRAFTTYAMVLGPGIVALAVARNIPGTAGAVADLHAGFWERAHIVALAEGLGMALGCLLVLVLCNGQTYRLFRWRALPGMLGLLCVLGLAARTAFTQTADPAYLFLPYVVLVVMVFLLGIRGAVLGTVLLSAMLCGLFRHGLVAAGQANHPRSLLAFAFLVTVPLGVTLLKRIDLEERVKEYQGEIDKLKSVDRLTGVANRRRFDLVLAREWQRATRDPKPIALLMIDADFFDLYLEEYGSVAADQCLRQIASKMADQPHRAYDLVSRLEGGRFSVLLPGASGEAVKRIGEEFRAEIAALDWRHDLSQFGRVTVSVGWASMMPENGIQPEVLIAAAEEALATARRKGKNRVEGFSEGSGSGGEGTASVS